MPATLAIEGMEFYSHHGCFPEERRIGTWFQADIYMEFDAGKAQLSDSLEDTVNYAEVYTKIKEEMAVPSKLLEHVARRITDRILQDYPQIGKIGIKLSKINPPLGEKIREVSIRFEQSRDEAD